MEILKWRYKTHDIQTPLGVAAFLAGHTEAADPDMREPPFIDGF